MPDMQDALKGAGYKPTPTEVKCRECGKPFQPKDPKHKLCSDCVTKNAGHKASATEVNCRECGKPFQPKDPKHKLCSDCVTKNAGHKASATDAKCRECGKPFQPRDPKHKLCSDCVRKGAARPDRRDPRASFETSYPDYFDEDGLLKPEYVTTKAEEIAEHLGNERPKMTMHQLRAFYGHVKLQEGALEGGRPFKQVLLEISKLKPFASERASKEKVPKYFEEFIARNVDKVKDEHSFLEGFVEHFQAVVAYCAGTIRR